jgi:hypothetical protein
LPLPGLLHPSPDDPTSIREVLHEVQSNANRIGGDTPWIVAITRPAIVRHGSSVTASDYRASGARNRTVTSSNRNGDKGEFRRKLLTGVDKAQKNDLVSRWICDGGPHGGGWARSRHGSARRAPVRVIRSSARLATRHARDWFSGWR